MLRCASFVTGMGMLAAWGGLNGEAGGERGAVSEDSSDDWLTGGSLVCAASPVYYLINSLTG